MNPPGALRRIVVLALVASGVLVAPGRQGTGGAAGIPGTPVAAAPTPTGAITEFRPNGISQTANSDPVGIATGPDGNIWYTDAGDSRIGKMATNGTGFASVNTTTGGSTPVAITAAAVNLWFVENSSTVNKVGRVATNLTALNEFGIQTPISTPTDIVLGPDGKLWMTEFGNSRIGTIAADAPAGSTAADFPITSPGANPQAITTLLGDLWFTEQGPAGNKIGRMNVAGAMVSEFPIGAGFGLDGLAAGPDGNLWFTQHSGVVGRMTPAGVTTTYTSGITGITRPGAITAGPDGNLWYVDQGANAIGRITVAGTVTEFSTGLTPNAFSAGVPPTGITVGHDGNIWFTEQNAAAALGRLAIQPQIALSAGSLTFGPQAIGTASGAQTIVVTSPAGGSLAIDSVTLGGADATDFRLASDCTGVIVPANPTCTVSVQFAPGGTSAGARSATLTFTDNAGTGTQTIALNGAATVGVVAFDQASVSFGTQAVGTTSTARTLTLTNASALAVTIASAAVAGSNPADFAFSDHCAGTTLAPGQTCAASVAFSPTVSGGRAASLVVTDNAANSPQTVSLTGTGVTPSLTASPPSLNFGRQQIGATATVRTLSLTNVTAGTLKIITTATGGPSAGDYAITADACSGKTLGPAVSCTVSIGFVPSAEGVRPGALKVTDSGPDSSQVVPLRGRGVHAAGYWLTAADGGVFGFGAGAGFFGSTGSIGLNKPMVGIAATPDGMGYWEVAADGGIFTFGNAAFLGSTGSLRLNRPIVGMAVTPDGLGYWLVASDGGVFAFGNAAFLGSTGSLRLNRPIVGMAVTPDGLGYWLVASDGGIFAFGSAEFLGSAASTRLNKPIVCMSPAPDGLGYTLAAADGGVFTYGSARYVGSIGSRNTNYPVVGMAPTPSGSGYWLAATDGGVFAFGDAPFFGSKGSGALNKPIVGIAAAP